MKNADFTITQQAALEMLNIARIFIKTIKQNRNGSNNNNINCNIKKENYNNNNKSQNNKNTNENRKKNNGKTATVNILQIQKAFAMFATEPHLGTSKQVLVVFVHMKSHTSAVNVSYYCICCIFSTQLNTHIHTQPPTHIPSKCLETFITNTTASRSISNNTNNNNIDNNNCSFKQQQQLL